ncbi:MAG: hypothetical protein AB1722_12360 [Pseudomonadota bacterium]
MTSLAASEIIGLIFLSGWLLGYWTGWLVNRKPPVIQGAKITANFVIDESALEHIDQARVFAWLEQRGMTWQPIGAVFDPNREFKK